MPQRLVMGVSSGQQRAKAPRTAGAATADASPGQSAWAGDVAITTASGDQGIATATGPGVAVVPDGSMGTIIVWEDNASADVHAQRVDSTDKPLWTSGGVTIAPSSGFEMSPRAVSDAAEGAYVVWLNLQQVNPLTQVPNLSIQRLDAKGNAVFATGGIRFLT